MKAEDAHHREVKILRKTERDTVLESSYGSVSGTKVHRGDIVRSLGVPDS